jgi:two-component system invasion response regulator UvrY
LENQFKIILVDDHLVVRKGIKYILAEEMLGVEISEATSAEELLQQIRKEKFDLVITDISMQGRSGLDLVKQLKIEQPDLPVLILSMHPETQYAVRALKAGASGYLNKEAAPEELIKAIQKIKLGKKYISPALAELLAENVGGLAIESSHHLLSDREFEVFKQISVGKSLSEIAEMLILSVSTVSTYRSRILEKMNLQTNADLTQYAVEHKLI